MLKEQIISLLIVYRRRTGMYFASNAMALGALDALCLVGGYCWGPTTYSRFCAQKPLREGTGHSAKFLQERDEEWMMALIDSFLQTIKELEE